MEVSKPLEDLNLVIGKCIKVELINGKTYTGILKSFDVYMNVVLEDCIVEDKEGNKKNYGVIFLKASYGVLNIDL